MFNIKAVLGLKAFTLAEVLITLTIIGVVSAITIPQLKRASDERQVITSLKSTYSILSQALEKAKVENGDAETWFLDNERGTTSSVKKIADILVPFFKVVEDCGTQDKNNRCIKKDPYLRLNGQLHNIDYAPNNLYYKVVLNNGVSIWWRTAYGAEWTNNRDLIYFFVDINGRTKPNQWGKDLFMFIYNGEKLLLSGAPNTYYIYTKNCINDNSDGIGCAYYVLTKNKMDY